MGEWTGAQPVPPGVVVDDLTGAPAKDLVEALRDLYLWQHEGWCAQPVSVPGVTAYARSLVSALRRTVSSAAWVGDRLAALAVVVEEPDGGPLVISETAHRSEPNGVALVAAVVADALRRLADAGVHEVGDVRRACHRRAPGPGDADVPARPQHRPAPCRPHLLAA
jgi:hypothetical protein